MRLAKRLIAVLAAPALLVGILVAGSASASPAAVTPGSQWGKVTFTANVIFGNTTYAINSTSCSLKVVGHPTPTNCQLNGAGTLNAQGDILTANLAVTDAKFGPITISLDHLHGCASGQAVLIHQNGSPSALIALTPTWTTGSPITETITLFNPPKSPNC